MFGVPKVFANTTLKPAMAVLALFSGVRFGLIVILVGLLATRVTDLFAGWGVWLTWVLGSGIVGMVIGLFPMLTKKPPSTRRTANERLCVVRRACPYW